MKTKHLYGEITVKNDNLWEQYTNSTFRHVENPTGQVMRHENLIRSIMPPQYQINSIIVMGNYKTKVLNKQAFPYPIVNANQILVCVTLKTIHF